MNNYWGPPDEDVEFPDWMLPDNHPMKMKKQSFRGLHKPMQSLEQACADALKKPAIPVILQPPPESNG